MFLPPVFSTSHFVYGFLVERDPIGRLLLSTYEYLRVQGQKELREQFGRHRARTRPEENLEVRRALLRECSPVYYRMNLCCFFLLIPLDFKALFLLASCHDIFYPICSSGPISCAQSCSSQSDSLVSSLFAEEGAECSALLHLAPCNGIFCPIRSSGPIAREQSCLDRLVYLVSSSSANRGPDCHIKGLRSSSLTMPCQHSLANHVMNAAVLAITQVPSVRN